MTKISLAKSLAALGISVAIAAPSLATENELNAWGAATASIDASEDVIVWAEVQTRFTDDASRLGQLLLRTGLGYRLDKTTQVYAGYAYINTDPVGPASSDEHRIWQQLSFRLLGDGKGLTISGRSRLEQRFVEGSDDMGLRYRQQLRLTAPMSETVKAVVWTEPFIGLNSTDWGQRNGINVWRNFVGIAVPLNDNLTLEPGYLNQYAVRNGEDRIDHVASISINTKF
ncbi:MAG: DUF2490 domain-containing protein [Sphingorhabdus sp.]